MGNIVEIKELFKTIDKDEILCGINLQISEGEIYGFLGPNGAGKTTLMKCMLSLSTITSGSIEIFGKNLQEHREEILSQVGSIIETPIFYEDCTAKEILEIHALYMRKNITESDIIKVLRMVGLKNTTKKVKNFSLGMRQRLGLARAFLTKPRLLILDEPINGLDPVGIQEIRNLLLSLSKEHGITILISSHILSEISQIADKIGIIKNGKMIELEIVGIFSGEKTNTFEGLSSDFIENTIYTDYATSQELLNTTKNNKVTMVEYGVDNPTELDNIIKNVEDLQINNIIVSKSNKNYESITSFVESITKLTNIIRTGSIVVGVVILSLVLMFWVRERLYEIGVLLSLGISKMNLILQVKY